MNKQGKGKIEYLDYTWNPITGCLHNCPYCYAEKITKRFGSNYINDGALHYLGEPMYKTTRDDGMMIDPYPFGFAPTFHRYRLDEPQKVKKPSVIGVVYMGDLFGDWVPDEWTEEVFAACEAAPWHTYVFLTKNPEKTTKSIGKWITKKDTWGWINDNWWFGTTVTCQEDIERIGELHIDTNCFVSFEPLLGPVKLKYRIEWAIIGSQTGPGAKSPADKWVQSVIDQCRAAGVPVFVKSPLYKRFPTQEWPEGMRK